MEPGWPENGATCAGAVTGVASNKHTAPANAPSRRVGPVAIEPKARCMAIFSPLAAAKARLVYRLRKRRYPRLSGAMEPWCFAC
jgi:hypothetical protein